MASNDACSNALDPNEGACPGCRPAVKCALDAFSAAFMPTRLEGSMTDIRRSSRCATSSFAEMRPRAARAVGIGVLANS
jgi:hypothetical protein